MTKNFNIIVLYGVLSFGLCYFTPWAVAAVVVSFLLYAFNLWMDRHSKLELEKINQKFKDLEERVNTISVHKVMGHR